MRQKFCELQGGLAGQRCGLECSSAQSAHCLMVLINGLASSGAFAHYCVLFMLSWVMMPTQQLLPQPFRWSEREIIIVKRWKRNRRQKRSCVSSKGVKKGRLGRKRVNIWGTLIFQKSLFTNINVWKMNPVLGFKICSERFSINTNKSLLEVQCVRFGDILWCRCMLYPSLHTYLFPEHAGEPMVTLSFH